MPKIKMLKNFPVGVDNGTRTENWEKGKEAEVNEGVCKALMEAGVAEIISGKTAKPAEKRETKVAEPESKEEGGDKKAEEKPAKKGGKKDK